MKYRIVHVALIGLAAIALGQGRGAEKPPRPTVKDNVSIQLPKGWSQAAAGQAGSSWRWRHRRTKMPAGSFSRPWRSARRGQG